MSRKEPRYVSVVSGADLPPFLSVAGDQAPSAAGLSLPGRYTGSPDDLQRQIRAVEQQIEALSASKHTIRSGMGRHSLPVGDHFSGVDLSLPIGFSAGSETPRRARILPEI